MKIIGLTGNSGSGKSTVSEILKKYSCYIIDADKIAHNVMKPKNCAYIDIVDVFGKEILLDNEAIDRKKLGEIVFNDKNSLKKLNEITHKHILKSIQDKINIINSSPQEYKCIIIDAPLLIESGLYKNTDEVWIVYADTKKRIERIKKRDSIDENKIIQRFNNQIDFENLKKYADIVIENNFDDTEDLEIYLKNILKYI